MRLSNEAFPKLQFFGKALIPRIKKTGASIDRRGKNFIPLYSIYSK
jgi:hypothetical protein